MLNAQNESLHAQLDELFLTMMAHITSLQFKEAEVLWRSLKAQVKGHMRYEEDVLLPLFLEQQLDEKAGLASGKTNQLVHGDHVILLRTEAAIDEAFHSLFPSENESSARRNMIHQLDIFLRWARVMEHHTDRETRTFYAPLDLVLGADVAAAHANALSKATTDLESG